MYYIIFRLPVRKEASEDKQFVQEHTANLQRNSASTGQSGSIVLLCCKEEEKGQKPSMFSLKWVWSYAIIPELTENK